MGESTGKTARVYLVVRCLHAPGPHKVLLVIGVVAKRVADRAHPPLEKVDLAPRRELPPRWSKERVKFR